MSKGKETNTVCAGGAGERSIVDKQCECISLAAV